MRKPRVLIIDDEPAFTRILRLNLERTGLYVVEEGNNAHGAVRKAREFRPDVILLDVVMPGLDGGDVAASLKKEEGLRNTPIIFLTAAISHKEAPLGTVVKGGAVFMSKPVSMRTLLDGIHAALPQPR